MVFWGLFDSVIVEHRKIPGLHVFSFRSVAVRSTSFLPVPMAKPEYIGDRWSFSFGVYILESALFLGLRELLDLGDDR